MKKSWWFIVGAWTGFLCAFFSLFLTVVDMGEMSGGYNSFSPMLAEASLYDNLFPIGLYNAFLIITFVLCFTTVAFLVLEEFNILHIEAKIMKLIKLIAGGSVALFGLLVLIFGICFTGSLNSTMSSYTIITIGGSPFACFFGSLLCGGMIAGSELLKIKASKKETETVVVDADE